MNLQDPGMAICRNNRYGWHAFLQALAACSVCAVVMAMTGCHASEHTIGQAAVQKSTPRTNLLLVANFDDEQQPSTNDKKTKPPETDDSKKPQQERRYTAPGVAIQQLTLLAIGTSTTGSSAAAELAGAGREASQAGITTGESILGRPGLTAPQPTVAGAVVSRPGLQQGPAGGLGFAGPFDILTPQFNPLSGPMGRCGDLAAAGFFGRNQTACVQHFRR